MESNTSFNRENQSTEKVLSEFCIDCDFGDTKQILKFCVPESNLEHIIRNFREFQKIHLGNVFSRDRESVSDFLILIQGSNLTNVAFTVYIDTLSL